MIQKSNARTHKIIYTSFCTLCNRRKGPNNEEVYLKCYGKRFKARITTSLIVGSVLRQKKTDEPKIHNNLKYLG